MDNDDWDLFSIVRKCKATTFTHPSTTIENIPPTTTTTTINNNTISPQNTTPSYFDDFTFTQENRSVLIAPLKSNDFIELDKLIINSNSTPIIPTLTTTIPTSSTPTTITSTTTIIPTTVTNTNVQGSNQNSTFFDFPIFIEQQHMQPNYLTELEKFILNFSPAATIPTPTFTTPTTPTIITPITTTPTPTTIIQSSTNTNTTTPTMASAHGTNQNTIFSDFPILIQHQHFQQNQNNQMSVLKPIACTEVTTAHFDHAYNHPSFAKQPSRDHNQLRILVPQTSSKVLPVTHPQKVKSRKIKNNQIKREFCVIEEKLRDDPWSWRKYGQKPIKGSLHPRSYYKCSTSEDCLARKQVEKSKTEDNTYVVTYVGVHNHKKPFVNQNSVIEISRNKSSNTRLPAVRETGSSSNVRNMGSSNVEMLQFDHPKNNNAQVLVGQSKIPHLETKLIESHLPVAGEFKSSLNVGNVGSPRGTMLQFDESETNNAHVCAHDDDILIPNMTAMSEDLLLDFNHLNGGVLFP